MDTEFDARVHEITAVSFPVLSPQPPGMYVTPGGCLQVVCARGLHRVAPAPLEERTQKSTPGPPFRAGSAVKGVVAVLAEEGVNCREAAGTFGPGSVAVTVNVHPGRSCTPYVLLPAARNRSFEALCSWRPG
ncbi:hypothetical protein ACWDBO_27860 [Streptomyces mirabilis]|uniref:hypothetical protein n=1 Tax=Streptomyces mirabilis TaxID=68239 RepID=UPI0033176F2C